MGITQHINGTDNVKSLANLAMLTGQIGRPGTGVNPLRGQNNVQGACDMACLPGNLPAYKKVTEATDRKPFEDAWGVSLPDKVGLTIPKIIDAAASGAVKALYVMGENPMMSDPDVKHVEKALKNLDLLVVQDIFLTETGNLAHVVLPTAGWSEKEGTYTNTERRVQRIRKAVDAPGEARPDWEIITLLANRLGANWKYASAKDIFEEVRKVTVSYAGIIGVFGVIIPCVVLFCVPSGQKRVDLWSLAAGGIFLLLGDLVAKNIAAIELPVGVVTAAVGCPFFVWLMLRK